MGKLEEDYKRCAEASSALDGRMFGDHISGFSDAEKASILNESERIDLEFQRLVGLLPRDTSNTKLLADIYYDWGTHFQQQAWFHYGFVKTNQDAMQATIDANNHAIGKMQLAYPLYTTQKARNATEALLIQYRKQGEVLKVEASQPVVASGAATFHVATQGMFKPLSTALRVDTTAPSPSAITHPLSVGNFGSSEYLRIKYKGRYVPTPDAKNPSFFSGGSSCSGGSSDALNDKTKDENSTSNGL